MQMRFVGSGEDASLKHASYDYVYPFLCLSSQTAHQNSTGDQSAEQSVRRLLSSAALINQAVGDALSDLLFCEAVLRLKGWGCEVISVYLL